MADKIQTYTKLCAKTELSSAATISNMATPSSETTVINSPGLKVREAEYDNGLKCQTTYVYKDTECQFLLPVLFLVAQQVESVWQIS